MQTVLVPIWGLSTVLIKITFITRESILQFYYSSSSRERACLGTYVQKGFCNFEEVSVCFAYYAHTELSLK